MARRRAIPGRRAPPIPPRSTPEAGRRRDRDGAPAIRPGGPVPCPGQPPSRGRGARSRDVPNRGRRSSRKRVRSCRQEHPRPLEPRPQLACDEGPHQPRVFPQPAPERPGRPRRGRGGARRSCSPASPRSDAPAGRREAPGGGRGSARVRAPSPAMPPHGCCWLASDAAGTRPSARGLDHVRVLDHPEDEVPVGANDEPLVPGARHERDLARDQHREEHRRGPEQQVRDQRLGRKSRSHVPNRGEVAAAEAGGPAGDGRLSALDQCEEVAGRSRRESVVGVDQA